MTLRKVATGEPFRPRAEEWNAFVDAAEYCRAQRQRLGVGSSPSASRPGMVLVRNGSDADQPQFAVLWLGDLALKPEDDASEQRFRTQPPVFDVQAYDYHLVNHRHECRYAVLQQPLKQGQVGWAMLHGVTQARIVVADAAHDYAEPDRSHPEQLLSAWNGSCRILWKQPGTGDKWAVVQFPVSDAPRLRVLNASGETIRDGYACQLTGNAYHGEEVYLTKPNGDSRLAVIAYTGPDLPPLARAALHPGDVMRFQVDTTSLIPGSFAGTSANSWSLTANRFGFLVLARETVANIPYVYARYSGVPPVLKAVSDETAAHTIDVNQVTSTGVTTGFTFTLHTIPEG